MTAKEQRYVRNLHHFLSETTDGVSQSRMIER
jgi:hypothetical protein